MKKWLAVLSLLCVAALLTYCNREKKSSTKASENPYSNSPYVSLRDSSVSYVGMSVCAGCHANVHATFVHTGMGESWDKATREKSAGKYDHHALVYDSLRDMHYRPHWQNDSLYITEFRLKGNDTVFRRTEKISWIVGSGQHTNSHIWRINNFLYQAPITYYTQKGIWDLAPGFDASNARRWDRIISQECMNCHNMYPQADFGAENRFISVKTGIECERCHGPGSAHVESMKRGALVDTSKEIDYTIVNPRNLSRDKQTEVCQRCHLQGISVLNEGKTFFDFKPGMDLSDVENVFMPRYTGKPEKFIMASHADRMKQSVCYQKAATLTCITCHNPHVSVKATPAQTFNAKCQSCHNGTPQKIECTAPLSQRLKVDDNCYKCHMPESETLDIPHVTIHDHRIHIPEKTDKAEPLRFTHLECLTQKNPNALVMAQGYLTAFESYSSQPFLLDSALYYLNQTKDKSGSYVASMVRYHFLKNDYSNVVKYSSQFPKDYKPDAWTSYRVGQGFYETGEYAKALERYNAALTLLPRQLDFMDQKGKALVMLKRNDDATRVFEEILQLNPVYEKAYSNLSFLHLQKGDAVYAMTLVDKALALDPDYEDALMNKAAIFVATKRMTDAAAVLTRVLELNPKNEKAKFALGHMRRS